MAGVTSNSTRWPCVTGPVPASTGPSIEGWLFHVSTCSSHPHAVMAWIVPPGKRAADEVDDDLRPPRAGLAGVVAHAVGRGALEREAEQAITADGGGHVELHSLAQRHRTERREDGPVDPRLSLRGDRPLVPRTARDGMNAAARDALRVRRARDLEPQVRRGHPV